jgi:cobalt/nickel transport system permease protein
MTTKTKIIVTLASIFFLISTDKGHYYILLLYFILAILIILLFRPGFLILFKRTFLLFLFPLSVSVFIPFANKGNALFKLNLNIFTITITDNGLTIFLTVLLKAFISILMLSALVISTSDNELLNGLRKIYVPSIIVSIIFIMYRYFFLLREESDTGQLAIKSRTFQKSYKAFNKKLAFLAGNLIIKTFDRAENIYKSMESRGFDGNFYIIEKDTSLNKLNWITITGFALILLSVKIVEILKIKT